MLLKYLLYSTFLFFLIMLYVYPFQIKQHLKNGKNVSMGFGFIEFDSMETATSVCRDLQVNFYNGGTNTKN